VGLASLITVLIGLPHSMGAYSEAAVVALPLDPLYENMMSCIHKTRSTLKSHGKSVHW